VIEKYNCFKCHKEHGQDALSEVESVALLEPGCLPDGVCPDCGGACWPVDETDDNSRTTIKLVKLAPEGDVGLIVNDHVVMTAEPALDDTDHVEQVAENLAAALGEPLMRIERPEPEDEDWAWEGIAADLAVEAAQI